MKYLLLVAAAAILLSDCKTDTTEKKTLEEGTVSYTLTYEKGVDTSTKRLLANAMTLKLKKNKLYVKFHGGFAEMKPGVIIDMDKQEVWYMNLFEKAALVKPLATLDYGKDYTEKGKGETILAHPCSHYHAKYGTSLYEIDATDDIPVKLENTVLLEGFYMSAFNRLPLKVSGEDSEFAYTFKAIEIKPEAIPDSVFEVPKGYSLKRQ